MVTCPAEGGLCTSTIRFSKESRENVHACYWFSRDPGYWKSYPYSLRVTQPGNLVFTSVDGLSDRGLVSGQSKRFQIRGNGASYGDSVYLVAAGASCSTANALDNQVYSTSVSEINNAFAVIVDLEYSTAGENLQLCYQFASLPAFNDKVSGSFHVVSMSGLNGALMSGSTEIAVSGLTKMFYYSGSGLAEGDRVGWITGDEVCSGSTHIASVAKDVSANAYYSPALFTSRDAGKTFTLCYKFMNEEWKQYESIAITIKQYNGVDSVSQGNEDVLVVSASKTFYLSDVDGSYGYSVGDHIHLVLNSNECPLASAYVYSTSVTSRAARSLAEGGEFQFVLDVPASLAGKTCYVCYGYGNETPFATGETIRVKSMPSFVGVFSGTSVDTEETVMGVILNVEKKLVFPSNTNVDATDRFAFVRSAAECVSETVDFQNINNEASVLYLSVLRTSSEEVNRSLYGCVKFGNEPAVFLSSVSVIVKNFAGIESSEGDSSVVVIGSPKRFVVNASGGAQAGDSILIASTSCTDPNAANKLSFPVTADTQGLVATMEISVANVANAATRDWFVCYEFKGEKAMATSLMISVLGYSGVESVSTTVGDTKTLVVKKGKEYVFSEEEGAEEGDRVALGCSCSSLLTGVESVSANLTAVLALSEKPSCSVGVCYYFREESPIFYNWSFTVHELVSINEQSSLDVAVVSGNVLTLSFNGASSLRDQFKWVGEERSCVDTYGDYSDSFGSELENLVVEEITECADESCTMVKLGGEGDLRDYFPSFQTSSYDNQAVGLKSILIGGEYTTISAYNHETRVLTVTGRISAGVGSGLKLVHASEMVLRDHVYMANVTLPVGGEGVLKLCYAFEGDAFFAYDAFKMTVYSVDAASTVIGGGVTRVMLKDMDNELVLSGVNMRTGDMLQFVEPMNDCSQDAVFTAPVTCVEGRCSAVVRSSISGSYLLCYAFANVGVQSTGYVMDVVGASIAGQSSDALVWFSVAGQDHHILYNTTREESFTEERVPRFVEVSNNGFFLTGSVDSLLTSEGSVVLFTSAAAECSFDFLTSHFLPSTSSVTQFTVSIDSEQYTPMTAVVSMMLGESVLSKTVTLSTDGVTQVAFSSSMEGWSRLVFTD